MIHLSINFCHEKWLLFLQGLHHRALRFSASITAAGTAGRSSSAAARRRVASSVKVMPPWDIGTSRVFKSWELYTKTWCWMQDFCWMQGKCLIKGCECHSQPAPSAPAASSPASRHGEVMISSASRQGYLSINRRGRSSWFSSMACFEMQVDPYIIWKMPKKVMVLLVSLRKIILKTTTVNTKSLSLYLRKLSLDLVRHEQINKSSSQSQDSLTRSIWWWYWRWYYPEKLTC